MTSASRHIQRSNAKVRGTTQQLRHLISNWSDVVEQLTTVTVITVGLHVSLFPNQFKGVPGGGSSVHLEPLSPELNPEAAE